jgi:hypothetical protein
LIPSNFSIVGAMFASPAPRGGLNAIRRRLTAMNGTRLVVMGTEYQKVKKMSSA